VSPILPIWDSSGQVERSRFNFLFHVCQAQVLCISGGLAKREQPTQLHGAVDLDILRGAKELQDAKPSCIFSINSREMVIGNNPKDKS
jgi:hypothetical protein